MHRLAFVVPLLLSAQALALEGDKISDVTSVSAVDPLIDNASVSRAMQRGLSWLLGQQKADGGWHSQTYGNMKGGTGTTALVLSSLSLLPKSLDDQVNLPFRHGVQFLFLTRDEHGLVSGPEGIADYSVYVSALLLKACAQRPSIELSASSTELCHALLLAQRSSANGWEEDHPDFGGWAVLGDHVRGMGRANSANVSVTMHVLDALHTRNALTPSARRDALMFLSRCQSHEAGEWDDGGFCFTPRYEDPLNKAGVFRTIQGGIRARSYPTATCDGLLALLACEIPETDSRLTEAVRWLNRVPAVTEVARTDLAVEPSRIGSGLDFYEVAAMARVARCLGDQGLEERRWTLVKALLERQLSNGLWSNSDARMREDNPLIATAFALSALARSLSDEEVSSDSLDSSVR